MDRSTKILLPPGVKRAQGRDRWPTPDTLKLKHGALLKHEGEWVPIASTSGKVYRGPYGLCVIVSLDDRGEPWGVMLHMSLSLPKGYPDWDLIYAVTRAVFGEEIDTMMPIPREEAFIHGAVEEQRRGKARQVFHVVEMPQAWQSEDPW
ncbi:MAG TPA: hypothetical protein VFB50_03445 [Chloroflexota bacterium]|nr:hypothetical protein [Chloroflexota bacterium]